MKKKKGISPLIATVLLVGFAVTMASIVITFVISETKNIGERIEGMSTDSRYCDSAKFGVEVFTQDEYYKGGVALITSEGDASFLHNVIIRNKGAFRIFGFRIVTNRFSDLYMLGPNDFSNPKDSIECNSDCTSGTSGCGECHGYLVNENKRDAYFGETSYDSCRDEGQCSENANIIPKSEQKKEYANDKDLVAYIKNGQRVTIPIIGVTNEDEDTTFKLAPIIQDPESKEAVVCVDEELSINWRDLCEKHHCENCSPEDCTISN